MLWGEGLPVPCGARGEPSVYCGGGRLFPWLLLLPLTLASMQSRFQSRTQ